VQSALPAPVQVAHEASHDVQVVSLVAVHAADSNVPSVQLAVQDVHELCPGELAKLPDTHGMHSA
jgi:hypothetical protein